VGYVITAIENFMNVMKIPETQLRFEIKLWGALIDVHIS